MNSSTRVRRGLFAVAVILVTVPAWGQRITFPEARRTGEEASTGSAVTTSSGSTNPRSTSPPLTARGEGARGPLSRLGNPSFDPYSTAPAGTGSSPAFVGPSTPGVAPPGYGPPTSAPLSPAYPGYPSSAWPAPPVLYPQGLWGGAAAATPAGPVLRMFHPPRVRHTWLEGDDGREMDTHDSELSWAVAFPNFLYTGQPILVAPTFVLHLWDGPQPPITATADLPPKAYSAYLQNWWTSDPNRQFGGELDVRVVDPSSAPLLH